MSKSKVIENKTFFIIHTLAQVIAMHNQYDCLHDVEKDANAFLLGRDVIKKDDLGNIFISSLDDVALEHLGYTRIENPLDT